MPNNRLYTDDNLEFTIEGLSYKNRKSAINSIEKIDLILDRIAKSIGINSCSPNYLHPRYYLETEVHIEKFILIQKMYRILALNNRAKVLYKKTLNRELGDAIDVFTIWLKEYKNLILKLKSIKLIKCN